ncbi:MAG: SixA phosphatase family protein [Aeromicrobium sp.]
MSELTLILFRHAKSDQSSTEADIDRPLNPRGQRQAPEAGRWLADNLDAIDLAVVSPATRARTTWDLASAELDEQPQAKIDDRIYGGSLLSVVRDLPDEARSVVLVGHNPGIEDLASLLANTSVPMPTSAIAVLDASTAWATAGDSWATLRAEGRPPG